MPQVLFYADAPSLAAYLGGAALLRPDLAAARCEALTLAQPEGAAEPSRALYFESGPELPAPADTGQGTSLFKGDLDRNKGELTVSMGRGRRRQHLKLVGGAPGVRELAQVLPPVAWSGGAPDVDEVVFLCPPGEAFSRLVSQHLELGRNTLHYAAVQTSEGPRMLLEVLDLSWFLLERWLARGEDGVIVYRRLTGPLGPRRIYVEWGYTHALETWLVDPADESQLLLIDRRGTHRLLERTDLEDIGRVLQLDPTRFETERLTPTEEPEPIEVAMRLEGRLTPRVPELWILPVAQRHRLEELLTQTPEEELRNLMVACVVVEGGDEDERLFAVREVLTGRAPRLLPLGDRAYAPSPGLPSLLIPCASALAPPLSNDRYARAFGLRAGELTILDADADGQITSTKLNESAFRPVESIVEFVIAGHAREVEEVMLAAPFDLGRFAEEDLVPTSRGPKRRAPSERKPRPARAEPEPEDAAPRKRGLIDKLLKPFRTPTETGSTRPRRRAKTDPRRAEIARVQRELVLEGATPERWEALSRLLFEDGQADEAVRSLEHSVWALERETATKTLELLEETLGDPELGVPAKDTLELFRRVLRYRHEVERTGSDVERYRSATEGIYEDLREQEDRLRKRSRWLLWRAVLEQTGDAIEVERQREAILSDLVVRGIEEREVPSFVRHILLDFYGQKAATGSGASAALAFLERAHRFAGSTLKHPAYRAEALAQVAWAFAELGQGERALEVAAQAERQAASKEGAPPHNAWRARAVARAGAVYERINGHDGGRAQLESSLNEIERLLPSDPSPRRQSQEMVDARKALVSWLSSVADAWASTERATDPLLRRALELVGGRPPNDLSQIVHDAHAKLSRLGLSEEVRQLALGLLSPDALKRARDSVSDYQHPDDAYRVHVQNVVETLELYRDGEAVTPDESHAIVALFRAHPQLIDEFTIGPLRIALRGNPASPWPTVEGLVGDLLQRGLAYEAHLVRIAGLWRMAELRERDRGADLLETVLAEAWDLPESQKKPPHRILTRLVHLIPAFGMRERGLRMLHQVNERTQQRAETGVYFRNELLLSTALAGSKLGDSRAAFELIQETATLAIADFNTASQGRRSGDPIWLLFETLDECVRGTVDLGDPRRGLTLVAEVGETARNALARTREGPGRTEGPYFYCRTLIGCGRAALALGDSEAATGHFGAAFAHFHSLSNWDLTEILQEAALTAGQLEGARRYQLAGQVIEQAEAPVAGGSQDRFGMDLVGQIAADMVRGESAFASALKRWKGREERSIRDVVAHEAVVKE